MYLDVDGLQQPLRDAANPWNSADWQITHEGNDGFAIERKMKLAVGFVLDSKCVSQA
jgi:hypothetical protein